MYRGWMRCCSPGGGDARRAKDGAHGTAATSLGRAAAGGPRGTTRLRAALVADWRVMHDAPPFAVALGAGAVGGLALVVRPWA